LIEKCEKLKAFVIDIILDIQEILKASICKGVTTLCHKFEHYSKSLNTIYLNCKSLALKLKLSELKVVIYDCLSHREDLNEEEIWNDVAYIIKNDVIDIFGELFKLLKKDTFLEGNIILDLQGQQTFCVFYKDLSEALFFNKDGLVNESKFSDIAFLQRKDLYYISIAGVYMFKALKSKENENFLLHSKLKIVVENSIPISATEPKSGKHFI